MDLAREATAFGGISLSLMGAMLAAAAERHAADARAWQEEWSRASGNPPSVPGPGLETAYRAGGLALAAAGSIVLAAAAMGRAFVVPPLDRQGLLLAATLIAGAGAGSGALKLLRRAPRLPGALKHDPLASPPTRPFGERISEIAGWILRVVWTGYGIRLLWEVIR